MTRPAQARSTYTVDFNGKSPRRATRRDTGRVPRVARTLALAHRIDGMIQAGEFRDLADAARAIGVTRARMTQIMNLLLLAPAIQEAILDLPAVTNGRDPVSERQLRRIVAEADWNQQTELWKTLGSDKGYEEQHDNDLDHPTDHANPNGSERASVIQSLSNSDDHGGQHPHA